VRSDKPGAEGGCSVRCRRFAEGTSRNRAPRTLDNVRSVCGDNPRLGARARLCMKSDRLARDHRRAVPKNAHFRQCWIVGENGDARFCWDWRNRNTSSSIRVVFPPRRAGAAMTCADLFWRGRTFWLHGPSGRPRSAVRLDHEIRHSSVACLRRRCEQRHADDDGGIVGDRPSPPPKHRSRASIFFSSWTTFGKKIDMPAV